jgi:hypothetical protein
MSCSLSLPASFVLSLELEARATGSTPSALVTELLQEPMLPLVAKLPAVPEIDDEPEHDKMLRLKKIEAQRDALRSYDDAMLREQLREQSRESLSLRKQQEAELQEDWDHRKSKGF